MGRRKVYFIIGLSMLLLGGLFGCRKQTTDTGGDVTGEPEQITVTPGAVSPEATPEVTSSEPSGTQISPAPEVTTEVMPEPTRMPEATPTSAAGEEDVLITSEEALQSVKNAVTDKKYEIEAGTEPLFAEGREYYVFTVLEKGRYLEPVLLVDKKDGTLHFYDKDGNISAFTKFPLDNVEIADGGEGELTEQQALEKLAGFNSDTLNLAKPFTEYETEVDTWTTIVNGVTCYGINVFDPKEQGRPLAGIYYVALDGTAVYTVDEDYNFILLN